MFSVWLSLYEAGRCMTNRDCSTVRRGWDRGAMPIIGLLTHLESKYMKSASVIFLPLLIWDCVKHKIDFFFYHYFMPLWELLLRSALGFQVFRPSTWKYRNQVKEVRHSQTDFGLFVHRACAFPLGLIRHLVCAIVWCKTTFLTLHRLGAEPQSSAFCFHVLTFLLVR